MAHCVLDFALFTFLAPLISLVKGAILKKGETKVGKSTRSADFMVTPSSGKILN